MLNLKFFISLSISLFFFSITLQQPAFSFNFDEVKNIQEPKVTIKVDDVKGKITKELFFSVMESKCSQFANTESKDNELIHILSPYMNGTDYLNVIAFDNTGQPVTKWQEKYPKEYLVIPNAFAFDMILTNSYGLQYKTADYYRESDKNYRESYYGCNYEFDRLIENLLEYYVYDRDLPLDLAKGTLKKWNDPNSEERKQQNYRADCYQPAFNFASDYNEFIKKRLEIIKSEKSSKEKQIEAEKALIRNKEEKENKKESEKAGLAEMQHKEEIKALANKWKEFGIPQDMLMSNIATYAGSAASGNLTTLVEFVDKLPGATKWEKEGQQFFLHQNNKDHATSKTYKAVWVFYDLRQKQGNIWLERVVINDRDYPSKQLFYLVGQVMSQQ